MINGIVLNGYLDVRSGESTSKDFRKRFVVLDQNCIKMYKKEGEKDIAGMVFAEDIGTLQDNSEEVAKYPYAFNVTTNMKTYVMNAPTQAKREEWKAKIKAVVDSYNEESQSLDVKYATIECFLEKGIRISGDIGSILMAQLTAKATQRHDGPKGCFYDCNLPVSSVMTQLAEHGWMSVSVFHTRIPHPLDVVPLPCDVLVFSHHGAPDV